MVAIALLDRPAGSRTIRGLRRGGASDAWDFVDNSYLRAGRVTTDPGLTVTRASEGYAKTSDGRLVKFGSGVLRRTDKGVLVEGARTNLLLRSQEFDDAAWTKVGSSVTANDITAPDGTLTADKYNLNSGININVSAFGLFTSGALQYISGSATLTAASHTASVFVKAGSGFTHIQLRVATVANLGSGTNFGVLIKLSDGTIVDTFAGATSTVTALANGWYRITLTFTATAATWYTGLWVWNDASITTNGTEHCYIWGAQLETASFPSSYIPTEGSTVTRAADQVTASLSGVAYPASLFAEIERVVDTGAAERWVEISFDASNVAYIRTVQGTPDNGGFVMDAAGSTVANITGASIAALNTSHKLAVRVATDDVRLCVNSTLATLDTSAALPSNPTTIDFSKSPQPFGYLRRAAIIPSALTDAELELITTPGLPPLFASFDLINGTAQYAGNYYSALSSVPGFSFTRASDAYYTRSDGTLQLFSSGALRIGDRGVLIEGARTNLLTYSQAFDDAAWTKTRASVTANATIAPDGTLTAYKLVENTDNNSHILSRNITASSSVYTYSIFLKAAERTVVRLRDSINNINAWVDLSAGTIGTFLNATGTIQALANGWYRVVMTGTTAYTNPEFGVRPATAIGTDTYTGDGTSGIYLWGAQLEAASFPSSYIPTAASTVTRASDVLTIGSVTGLDYPLSLTADFERVVDTGDNAAIFSVSNNTTDQEAYLYVSSADTLGGRIRSGAADQMNNTVTGALAIGVDYKSAMRIAANDGVACMGGTLSAVDTSVTVPAVAPTNVRFGMRGDTGLPGYLLLRSARIYSGALSYYWLKGLTT